MMKLRGDQRRLLIAHIAPERRLEIKHLTAESSALTVAQRRRGVAGVNLLVVMPWWREMMAAQPASRRISGRGRLVVRH